MIRRYSQGRLFFGSALDASCAIAVTRSIATLVYRLNEYAIVSKDHTSTITVALVEAEGGSTGDTPQALNGAPGGGVGDTPGVAPVTPGRGVGE